MQCSFTCASTVCLYMVVLMQSNVKFRKLHINYLIERPLLCPFTEHTRLYYPSHLQPHNSTVAMRDHDRNNISSGSFLVSRADCSAAYSLSLLATGRKNICIHHQHNTCISHTDIGHQLHENVTHQLPQYTQKKKNFQHMQSKFFICHN